MLTFEKVLEIFADYLTADETILKKRMGGR